MSGFQTRQMVVNGVRSPVLLGGSGVSGEAVVFVHGNPDTSAYWEPLMTRVAEFCAVVAPDMPGFGGADKGADQTYTLAAYADHLDGLIRHLGIDAVHLVVHDFGGWCGLTWAAANPGKVASITAINSGLLLDYKWHRVARIWRTPVAGEVFMHMGTHRFARFVIRHDNPGLPQDWVERIADNALSPETMRAILRLYRNIRTEDMEALVEPLRDRDPDTLVVFGADDVYIPVEQAELQRRSFPRARIEILPGVGHWAWLEQPDLVAGLVVPFLRERVGRPT